MPSSSNRYYLKNAVPALIIMAVVFLLPVGTVFLKAFSVSGEIGRTFTDRYTWRLLLFTVFESSLSALISVCIAIPFALFFSRYTFFGRRTILTVSDAAFALPAILAVLGFVIYYGNNGILNRIFSSKLQILYSFKAIILAHVYLNFPVAFSLITSALLSTSDQEEQASRLLGASEFRTFFRITLPKMWGTIISAFTLIFLFCFPSFLIVMSLGGNPRFFTMEAEIYKRTYTDVNPASAASVSIFSFLIMTLILIISGYGTYQVRVQRRKVHLKKTHGRKSVLAFVLCLIILLFMAPPMLSIIHRSFFNRDGVFTLKAWTDIARRSSSGAGTSIRAVINSLIVAFASSVAAVSLASSIAMDCAKRKSTFIALLTSLPMAVGSVSLGLGFSFLSAKLPFRNTVVSYVLVFLAHLVVVMPFAVRTILPGARKIPQRLSLAAKTMGGEDREIYRKIEHPLLKPYRRRALAFSFALSLGEVNATLTLGEGRVTTIPVLIYKMINQYNYQGASALAVILMAVAVTVFAIGESKGDSNGLS